MQDRILALAGIFQAARLVQQLSREGRTDTGALSASLHSVLLIDAPNVAAVYGGARGVALGLQLVRDKLGGDTTAQDLEMAKYVIALMQLEAALRRRPEVAATIQDGIRAIEAEMDADEPPAEEDLTALAEKLADLYTRTLSTLSPRIMVTGEQGFLGHAHIAARVRATLFAGVRSAVLWRQLGGSRWQLLLSRRQLSAAAGAQLAELKLR